MTRSRILFCGNLILSILLVSCNLPGNQPPADPPAPPPPTDTPSPPPTATPALAPDDLTYRLHLKITTTSDWTSLRLRSGGDWYNIEVASASPEAAEGGFFGGCLTLNQEAGRAADGGSVELVAEALLAHLDPELPLVFEVERGHIGETRVEISGYRDNALFPITNFTWEGNKSSGPNAQTYEVSSQPFLGSNPNEYIVIAQMNFWYFGPGDAGGFENTDRSPNTFLEPFLGKYYSEDPDVVYQQIEWAVEYGVDAFSIEWDSPEEDSLGIPMERIMDEVFLKSPNIHKIRWAIFYDFPLRMHYFESQGLDMSQSLNFDQPLVYDAFVSDFVHFATKYFHNPQYLTIDGRPVVYIWATNAFTGNYAGAINEARQKVADLGYDVYIVGDEVCYGCFNAAHAALHDATTTFTFLIPGVDQPALQNAGHAAETTDTAFTWWRGKIANLQVTGRDELVNFQPAWAPQYDDSGADYLDPNDTTTVLAESREQVSQMAEVARRHAEPAGEEGLQLVWVNTWNCWGESTSIEPTIIDDNPKYPGGNYGFDFLEIIREVYGPETYYTSP